MPQYEGTPGGPGINIPGIGDTTFDDEYAKESDILGKLNATRQSYGFKKEGGGESYTYTAYSVVKEVGAEEPDLTDRCYSSNDGELCRYGYYYGLSLSIMLSEYDIVGNLHAGKSVSSNKGFRVVTADLEQGDSVTVNGISFTAGAAGKMELASDGRLLYGWACLEAGEGKNTSVKDADGNTITLTGAGKCFVSATGKLCPTGNVGGQLITTTNADGTELTKYIVSSNGRYISFRDATYRLQDLTVGILDADAYPVEDMEGIPVCSFHAMTVSAGKLTIALPEEGCVAIYTSDGTSGGTACVSVQGSSTDGYTLEAEASNLPNGLAAFDLSALAGGSVRIVGSAAFLGKSFRLAGDFAVTCSSANADMTLTKREDGSFTIKLSANGSVQVDGYGSFALAGGQESVLVCNPVSGLVSTSAALGDGVTLTMTNSAGESVVLASGSQGGMDKDGRFCLTAGSVTLAQGKSIATASGTITAKTGSFTVTGAGAVTGIGDKESFTAVVGGKSYTYTLDATAKTIAVTGSAKATVKYLDLAKVGFSLSSTANGYYGLTGLFDNLPANAAYNSAKNTITLKAAFTGKIDASRYAPTLQTVDGTAVNKGITLIGNTKTTTLKGGKGNDNIQGSAAADKLYGGAGNDSILGGNGNDLLDGGIGNDTLRANAGNNSLYGGKGNDALYGGTGKDTFYYAAGDGADAIYSFEAGKDAIRYTNGALKSISIDKNKNVILTHANGKTTGTQKLMGKGVKGQYANITSPSGKTTVTVKHNFGDYGKGNSWTVDTAQIGKQGFHGSTKIDTLTLTGKTAKTINLTAASLYTSIDNVNAAKVTAALNITGTSGANVLTGGTSNDILYAGAGNDTLKGGKGNDKLYAQSGNNTLWGEAGNDYLEGGTGTDILRGGLGNDTLKGGKGVDKFQFYKGDGKDTIQGAAKNDILYLYNINNIKSQAKFKMSGKNLVMSFTTNKNDSITIANWSTSGLNKFVVGGKTYSLKKSGSTVSVK